MRHFFVCLLFALFLCSCAVNNGVEQEKTCVFDSENGIWNPSKMLKLWAGYSLKEKESLDAEIQDYYTKLDSISDPAFNQYFESGVLLYKRCRLKESYEAFENALKINRYSAECLYLMGCVSFFIKRYDLTRNYISRSKHLGFKIDPETDMFFRGTCSPDVDLYRAKIKLDLEKQYDVKGLYITSVEQLLDMSDNDIDLATASLLLSKDVSEKIFKKSFDTELYRKKIDEMVEEILMTVGGETRMEWVYSSIIHQMFFGKKFRSVIVDSADRLNDSYHLMNFVLDYRKGYCMSLSMLYLSISERMGIPVYGVVAPGHFFVRYDDVSNNINIETTAMGKNYTNDHYRKEYPNLDTVETLYYKNLTKREALGCYLNNIGIIYRKDNMPDEAVRVLKLSLRFNPSFSEPYINLGNVYTSEQEFDLAVETYKKGLEFDSRHSQLLKGLGRVYYYKNNLDDALEELKIAVAINKKDPDIHKYLGLVFYAKEDYRNAIFHLRRALVYDSESFELNFMLAKAYYKKSSYKSAWKVVNKLRSQGKRLDKAFLKLLTEAEPES